MGLHCMFEYTFNKIEVNDLSEQSDYLMTKPFEI